MSQRHKTLLLALLIIGYGWLFPWSEQIHNPNEMVRIYAVRALAEHGTYAIARREVSADGQVLDFGPIYDEWGYVNDKAIACDDPKAAKPNCTGSLYACKAPGLNQLGALPQLLFDRGWRAATGHGPTKPWIVWWLRLCCVVVPTICGWMWLAKHLHGRLNRTRLGVAVVLAGALGSLSLTYGQMFAGHQPAGAALVLAFLAIARTGQTEDRGKMALAGLGIGLAVIIEFTAAPAALLLLAWLLVRRRRWRDLPWLVAGGLGPALLLAHFDWRAFGAPWRLPYGYVENQGFVQDMAPGFFGIHLPDKEKTAGSLFSPFTGLYFWAPWMALAWLGLTGTRARQAQTPSLWQDRRGEALVAWLICAYFLFFQCTHSLWRGGWVVGPRYITAMVPFAAIAAAYGLDSLHGRLARVGELLLAIGAATAIVVTGSATAVSQGFPLEVYNPLSEVVLPLLRHGFVWSSPPLWLGLPAWMAALPWALALVVGALWAIVALQPPSLAAKRWPVRVVGSAVVAALALMAVMGLASVPGKRDLADRDGTLRFVMRTWWPQPLAGARPLPEPKP